MAPLFTPGNIEKFYGSDVPAFLVAWVLIADLFSHNSSECFLITRKLRICFTPFLFSGCRKGETAPVCFFWFKYTAFRESPKVEKLSVKGVSPSSTAVRLQSKGTRTPNSSELFLLLFNREYFKNLHIPFVGLWRALGRILMNGCCLHSSKVQQIY